jgi:hypothetical protein
MEFWEDISPAIEILNSRNKQQFLSNQQFQIFLVIPQFSSALYPECQTKSYTQYQIRFFSPVQITLTQLVNLHILQYLVYLFMQFSKSSQSPMLLYGVIYI